MGGWDSDTPPRSARQIPASAGTVEGSMGVFRPPVRATPSLVAAAAVVDVSQRASAPRREPDLALCWTHGALSTAPGKPGQSVRCCAATPDGLKPENLVLYLNCF